MKKGIKSSISQIMSGITPINAPQMSDDISPDDYPHCKKPLLGVCGFHYREYDEIGSYIVTGLVS